MHRRRFRRARTAIGTAQRGEPAGSDPTRTVPVQEAGTGRRRRLILMLTALLITVVVIAFAAGFILNRDQTRLRP
jgi:hypothetical protein